ncbi:MAG TPA: Gfo/Idh/MocA family oxidoreductase [Planctomycetota bacterium]|nr:Gfo/Idh/MocA family oxidoreductase [Planctomycetota bacterium]
MAKLKIGIIGAGGIMRGAHMPGWKIAPDCEIVAVCDSHLPTAEAFAKDFAIPAERVFTDYRELVEVAGLDAVDIGTPNQFHTPAVLAALARKLHVICEKPLAVTTAEVREMQAAAKKAGTLLMTAQNMRWGGPAQALKKFADAGSLGEVYHARIHAVRRNWLPGKATFIDHAISGGGPCMDIGVHALDLGLWLMGFPEPVRVSGTTMVNFAKGNDIPGGWGEWDRALFSVEDFASGFIHFANGATMVLEASWLQHQQEKEDFSARLFGKKASVHWPSGDYASVVGGALVDGRIQEQAGLKPSHQEEILAFVDAIQKGKPSPVPVEQTIKVISILEAIVESGKTGREVVLAEAKAAKATK